MTEVYKVVSVDREYRHYVPELLDYVGKTLVRVPGKMEDETDYCLQIDDEDVMYFPRSGLKLVSMFEAEPEATSPLDYQVGGDHYSKRAIQPIEYIMQNKLGFAEGNIVKYVTRHADKKGAEDIRKVIHYAQFILQYVYGEKA